MQWRGHIAYEVAGKMYVEGFSRGNSTLQGGPKLQFEVREASEMLLEVRLIAKEPVTLRELFLETEFAFTDRDRIFCNGFQSWTESRLYRTDERIPPLRMPFPNLINTTGDYTFYPNPGRKGYLHSYTWSYLTRPKEMYVVADLMPRKGYLIIEWLAAEQKLRLREECAGRRIEGPSSQGATPLMQVRLNTFEGEPDNRFEPVRIREPEFQKAFRYLNPRKIPPIAGWTSWYYHYTGIDQPTVQDNLRAFRESGLPIDLFQIDDGWQPAIGDWLSANEKFPDGMAALAQSIRKAGYQPGLWLAPFIVERKSGIFKEHPDWLLTYDGERPVEAGYNPGWGGALQGTYYVLDLDKPEVRDHLKKVFDRVLNEWGFEMVKLDFLFATGLIPRNGRSRAQHMAAGIDFLRACCGDKLILGCGVPLGPCFGVVDYCRIGPDIGLSWDMKVAKFARLRERISTRNAIVNTVMRRHLDGRAFGNDPDVFILRKQKNRLKPKQRFSLFLTNAIFGRMFLTSDNPAEYDEETLRLFRSAFPLKEREIISVLPDVREDAFRVLFRVNGREYCAVINASKSLRKFVLPEGLWFEAPRWKEGEDRWWYEGPSAVVLRPFESRILLRVADEKVALAGDTTHLFPGAGTRLSSPDGGNSRWVLTLDKQNARGGKVWVQCDDPKTEIVYGDLAPRRITFQDKDFWEFEV
jgi:alpha-galactosidase